MQVYNISYYLETFRNLYNLISLAVCRRGDRVTIQYKHLDHAGGLYIYGYHSLKANLLCNNGLDSLKGYLADLFKQCPDQYFFNGPRSSSLKFKLPVDLIEVRGHEMSVMARHALEVNHERFHANHPRVQMYLLENDSKTLAMEVPLWIQNHEIEHYVETFRTIAPLTGHIDLLRIDDGKIWIWDYKPNAAREKYAATQVYFYALMLSKRTGIKLEHFRCGYFDSHYTYLFQPTPDLLLQNDSLKAF